MIDEPVSFPAWRRISDTASLIYERPLSQSDGLERANWRLRSCRQFGPEEAWADRATVRSASLIKRDGLVQTPDPGW